MQHATLRVVTTARTSIVPIGTLIQAEIDRWDSPASAVLISVSHTTCGVTLNEPEPGLLKDLVGALERFAPWAGPYAHNRAGEDNAAAHIRAMLVGQQLSVSLRNGQLVLGTWQDVLLVECDGPRTRTIELTPLR